MTTEILSAVLALLAASSGLCMAYVGLDNYRYRKAIKAFFTHVFSEAIRTDQSIPLDQIDKQGVDYVLADANSRHGHKKNPPTAWFRYLMLLRSLPEDSVPLTSIDVRDEDNKCHKMTAHNWFCSRSGRFYRRVYMRDLDNHICASFAGTLLCTLVLFVAMVVLGTKLPDMLNSWWFKMVFPLALSSIAATVWALFTKNHGVTVYKYFTCVFAIAVLVNLDGLYELVAGPPAAGAPVPIINSATWEFGSLVAILFVGILGLVVPSGLAFYGRYFVVRDAMDCISSSVNALMTDLTEAKFSNWDYLAPNGNGGGGAAPAAPEDDEDDEE